MNVTTARTIQSSDSSSRSVPHAGVSSIAAIPATMTMARIGSERASTSVSSSFRNATKTTAGRVSTRGTRRHHARTRACAASEPPSARRRRSFPARQLLVTRRTYRPEGYDSAGTSASIPIEAAASARRVSETTITSPWSRIASADARWMAS